MVPATGENGHIYHDGHLLCGKEIDKIIFPLKKKFKKARPSIVQTRRVDVPLCGECQEAYKEHPALAWRKFVGA